MRDVMSVMGSLEKEQLGVVVPHEHIFIDMRVFYQEPDEISARIEGKEKVTIEKLGILKRNPFLIEDNVILSDPIIQSKEINELKYAGCKTIVDVTNIGLGRDPNLLKKMAVDTGMNIIAGSGYYVKDSQRKNVLDFSIEQIHKNIVHDLTEGIGHTKIKAGVIGEIGISHIIHPFEKKSLIGACRAQKDTQKPLMVHINPWCTNGLQAIDIALNEKVNPKEVVICHSDVENNEDYIFKMLDKGVFVEFDNFGKEMLTDKWDCVPGSGRFVTDLERVKLVKKIVDRGYVEQLILSCDICLKTLLHSYGGWGYDHVLTHIVPLLEEFGVSTENIKQIVKRNPINWLLGEN